MRYAKERKGFRQDFKREQRGRYRNLLTKDGKLREVIRALENDERLDFMYYDHPLKGKWRGSRECHLAPDFVLIYTLEGDDILWLERLGSHSELLDM